MSESQPGPELLRAKQARELIGAPNHAFLKLYKHLHILRLPHDSRRFAAPYLSAVDMLLSEASERYYSPRLEAFAASEEGHNIIDITEQLFETRLRAGLQTVPRLDERVPAVSVPRSLPLLNIGRATIDDWERSSALETFRVGRTYFIAETALREAISWERPLGYVERRPPLDL